MKDDIYRLKRISSVGHQLLDVVDERALTRSDVMDNYEIQWLISTPLYNIGEQANCISREFTDKHPEIPWAQIAGLRHRLVHDYEGVNWSLISAVLFYELDIIVDQVDALISQVEA